jgi:hypothetical protein
MSDSTPHEIVTIAPEPGWDPATFFPGFADPTLHDWLIDGLVEVTPPKIEMWYEISRKPRED